MNTIISVQQTKSYYLWKKGLAVINLHTNMQQSNIFLCSINNKVFPLVVARNKYFYFGLRFG